MKSKKLIILIILTVLLFGSIALISSSSSATAVLWNISDQGQRLFLLVTVSALIDSINPCAFSVLLLTIAFLFSIGTLRQKIFRLGIVYIFGIFIAYLALGLGILNALHLFNTPHFMGKVGAILLISLGAVNLINRYFPAFPLKLKIPSFAHGKIADLMKKTSVPAVLSLGVLVGLCEFPCTGGPYLAVLGLLSDSQTYPRGAAYLLWYNLLFVLPLIATLLLASDRTLLLKIRDWRKKHLGQVRYLDGIIMIALGILFFFF